MSKAAKIVRRTVAKTTQKDFISMVEWCWSLPWRLRWSIAWMIFKGKKKPSPTTATVTADGKNA